ncbi:MAG: serine hydrolase [Desulfobacterales bacterium]
MGGNRKKKLTIEGTVAPGFESVKKLYEHNMRTLEEENTQLCVYVGEDKVVDLWASATEDPNFSPDSLVNVFSSSKNFEAIAMAALAGKGLLNYNARISEYWPEFAANGKEDVTVADLMRHEAGLAVFDTTLEKEDILAENIKLNNVGVVIENHAQKFRRGAGNKREYHAITRGWIVNEVFRRIDPEGRTIGQFLREEISGPLEADVFMGVKDEQLNRISKLSMLGIGFQIVESLKPAFLGRRIEFNCFQGIGKLLGVIPLLLNNTMTGAPEPVRGMKGMGQIEFWNDPAISRAEIPSANAKCSARGLATVAAMMANGGKWAGQEFLNEAAWAALHEAPIKGDMGFTATTFTQGGVALFPPTTPECTKMDRAMNQGREGFYGWMGLGGSLFQWHPQYKIGFGYVPTSLYVFDFVNERGKAYQAEVLSCVEKMSPDVV